MYVAPGNLRRTPSSGKKTIYGWTLNNKPVYDLEERGKRIEKDMFINTEKIKIV